MDKIQVAAEFRLAVQMFAQSLTDDAKSLRIKSVYPKWKEVIGETVEKDFKFTYEDDLYKTIPPTTTIVGHYIPSQGTESLYTKINETNAGTIDDPIPYSGNMELFNGMYYSQDGVIYICTRDSGQPLYHALADLVGVYVEVHA